MLKVRTLIDKYFVPEKFSRDEVLLHKSRMLTWVHLILIAVAFFTSATLPWFLSTHEIPIFYVLLGSVLTPFVFKRFANFDLSANLLAFLIGIICVSMVRITGGLFSDNLLWLIICPMVVSLFAVRRFDVIWYLLFVAFLLYQYQLDQINPVDRVALIEKLPSDYYATGFFLFATIVLGIIWMFKFGNNLIFRHLQKNRQAIQDKNTELLAVNFKLNELTGQLTRSNKELETFASVASHDLKEPLRMVTMYTQLLKSRMRNELTAEQHEFMKYIDEGTHHMQKLLDDILEYSRVGRSNERVKSVDLDDVLYYVKRLLTVSIHESEATIQLEGNLPEVYGRYSELVQVFQNLISNAIKFRKPGVKPVVTISSSESDGFHLISISDNGIGIDERYADKVFQMFERLHTRQEYAGTGIGLALCMKVISEMGGEIWLKSKPNHGTIFYIKLPVHANSVITKAVG